MKILGLPGVKAATRPWLQQLLVALADSPTSVSIQDYRHWPEDSGADLETEAIRLEGVAVDLVIAKSLGTLVATRAFAGADFRPSRAVLIGCPLARHGADGYEMLKRFAGALPTLFIQQSADFNGAFGELEAVVGALPGVRAVEVPGNDHVYGDIDELRQIIRQFLRGDEN